MPRPTDAIHWYYRVFKAAVEVTDLLHDNPNDWNRLQVWDGTTLKPAMPENFSGVPDEEKINKLYSYVQNNQLFFFYHGDTEPHLLTANGFIQIPKEPKEPVPPPPLTITDPKKEEQQRKDHAESVRQYHVRMDYYHTAQDIHRKNPAFLTAVDGYNAGRDMAQERKEFKARGESGSFQRMKYSREKAERVITQMMAPRPDTPPEVFYREERHATYSVISFDEFDKYIAPYGYDLPQNSKLDDYDAATINLAMVGVKSEMEKIFFAEGNVGPAFAQSCARDGFHYMITALFGYSRIKQPMTRHLGDAFKMGQAAIEAYNGGDPSLLGQRLGEVVRNIQPFFTGTGLYRVNESLVAASKLTERLLDLFERKPDIWEATGLTEQNREFMRGYVQMGKLYDNYADSQIKFNDAFFKGTQLSQEENAEILADAVLRRMLEIELKKDSDAAESTKEYEAGLMEAMAKDQVADQKLKAWVAENKEKFKDNVAYDAAYEKQKRLLDCRANVTMYSSLPCEHPIITKLSHPGMLERLRQNLMKDPAILEQASKSPMEFKPKDLEEGKKLDALVGLANQLVERSQKQAWFDNIKSMLTKNDPNAWLDPAVASDSNRLMIAQGKGRSKKMVTVASLLNNGLQALQDPDENTLDLLYENAKSGGLYFYGKDKDMPARLETDGMKPSVQQLEPVELPTRWQRFWNIVTFGLAYAKECNIPDKDPAAYKLIVQAREEHAVPAQNTEAPRPEGAANEQEQPEQVKTVQIKPWRYQVEDTRTMDPDDFVLNVAIPRSFSLNKIDIADALEKPDFKPEDYFSVVTQRVEAWILKKVYLGAMKFTKEEERESFVNGWKENYPAMMSGLGKYVFDNTDKDLLIAYCQDPRKDSPAYTALIDASEKLINTAVAEYTKETNALNTENEKQQQKAQPKEVAELTNNNPEPQKQNTGMGMNG